MQKQLMATVDLHISVSSAFYVDLAQVTTFRQLYVSKIRQGCVSETIDGEA